MAIKRGRPRKQQVVFEKSGQVERRQGYQAPEATERVYQKPKGPAGEIRLYGVYRHAGFWVMRSVTMLGDQVVSVDDSDINPLDIISAKIMNAVEAEGL